MLGIGEGELLIIVVFAFLLFGPDKLPQMGRTIGRALRQFRETQEKMTSVVQTEVIDPMAAAAQAPKPKKPAAVAAAEDEDADVANEKAAEARKETFAERRARLAAEKAAKEAADEGAAPADGVPAAAGAKAPAAADAPAPKDSDDVVQADAVEQEEAPAEDAAVHTTADLYARRPRKHRVAAAEEDAAAGEGPAPDVSEAASATDASSTEGGER